MPQMLHFLRFGHLTFILSRMGVSGVRNDYSLVTFSTVLYELNSLKPAETRNGSIPDTFSCLIPVLQLGTI